MLKNNFSIGARLQQCANFVRKNGIVADIGTDHAYLPIWLIANELALHVYASDINEEPVKLARSNIAKSGLNDKITTFIGNGLEKIPKDKVNDIIIAGMGSENIIEIINSASWLKNSAYRLILQPMSRTEKLRKYLYEQGFDIIEEKSVCEGKRVYTVICAEFIGQGIDYDDIKVYVGALKKDDPNLKRIIEKSIGILESEACGLSKKGDTEGYENIKRLTERLRRYMEIKE